VVTDILQPTHLLFILVVALVVLGPKRLPEVARTLGNGLRDFRSAISGESDERPGRPGHFLADDQDPAPSAQTDTEEPVAQAPAVVSEPPAPLPVPPAPLPASPVPQPEPVVKATPAPHEPSAEAALTPHDARTESDTAVHERAPAPPDDSSGPPQT
jgi:sec-independent protein translocase protein TatA